VTDRLHMRRAAGVFANLGFAAQRASVPIHEGHEDNVSMLYAGLREFAALGYYRMRGWIGDTPSPMEPAQPIAMTIMRGTITNVTGPIVLLGASYAAGWPLAQINGIPVVNRGVAGQQSFELLERFDRDVASASPRAVILWGFSNDIHRAEAGAMDRTIARVRDSYAQLIARARRHGIEPILATELTLRPPDSVGERVAGWTGTLRGKESYQDQVNRHVLALNRWLIDAATGEGLLVLDLQSVLSEPNGRRHPAFAQPDGSHITSAGYDALTSFVTPIFEEHFLAR
jgi:lysophospholipase L1-like esterase